MEWESETGQGGKARRGCVKGLLLRGAGAKSCEGPSDSLEHASELSH